MNRLPLASLAALFGAATLATSPQTLQAQTRPSMAKPIGLVGIVAGATDGTRVFLRANGQTFRVRPLEKVSMKGIRGGDRVRVWGRPTGLRVAYANVRVLASRSSDNPNDYNPAPGTTITDTGAAK